LLGIEWDRERKRRDTYTGTNSLAVGEHGQDFRVGSISENHVSL
jgi:hypothetical protein